MYRIGELVKMAEITPNTTRYYEKQQMMEHEVHTRGGFRLCIESDLQQLKLIRRAGQLGLNLESIHELPSIRIDPEHRTCQESKGIVQERLQEVGVCIAELRGIQRSLQRLNSTCCGATHSSVYCSILEALEQRASGVKSGC